MATRHLCDMQFSTLAIIGLALRFDGDYVEALWIIVAHHHMGDAGKTMTFARLWKRFSKRNFKHRPILGGWAVLDFPAMRLDNSANDRQP